MFQPERVADGDDAFAEKYVVWFGKRSRLEILWHFATDHADEAEVVGRIESDEFAFVRHAVPQADFDVMGAFDNVQVGQDEAAGVDDDSTAQWIVFLDDFLLHSAKLEEIEIRKEIVVSIVDFYQRLRSDVDNPWKGVRNGLDGRRRAVAQGLFLRLAQGNGRQNQYVTDKAFHDFSVEMNTMRLGLKA